MAITACRRFAGAKNWSDDWFETKGLISAQHRCSTYRRMRNTNAQRKQKREQEDRLCHLDAVVYRNELRQSRRPARIRRREHHTYIDTYYESKSKQRNAKAIGKESRKIERNHRKREIIWPIFLRLLPSGIDSIREWRRESVRNKIRASAAMIGIVQCSFPCRLATYSAWNESIRLTEIGRRKHTNSMIVLRSFPSFSRCDNSPHPIVLI